MQTNALSDSSTSAALLQVGTRTTRSASLQVVTAEGDRIALSATSTRVLGAATASASSDGLRATATVVESSRSDEVTLSVEGDLSHAELVDLQKVIKAFEQAAARGDASRFLQRLSRPDLDTVASVGASATTETQAWGMQLAADS